MRSNTPTHFILTVCLDVLVDKSYHCILTGHRVEQESQVHLVLLVPEEKLGSMEFLDSQVLMEKLV